MIIKICSELEINKNVSEKHSTTSGTKEKKRIIVILFSCGAGGTILFNLYISKFTYFYPINKEFK